MGKVITGKSDCKGRPNGISISNGPIRLNALTDVGPGIYKDKTLWRSECRTKII